MFQVGRVSSFTGDGLNVEELYGDVVWKRSSDYIVISWDFGCRRYCSIIGQ